MIADLYLVPASPIVITASQSKSKATLNPFWTSVNVAPRVVSSLKESSSSLKKIRSSNSLFSDIFSRATFWEALEQATIYFEPSSSLSKISISPISPDSEVTVFIIAKSL